jgi:hypothetical protein
MTSDSEPAPKPPLKPRRNVTEAYAMEVWEEIQRDKEERERERIARGDPPHPVLPPLTETLSHTSGYYGYGHHRRRR